MHKATTWEVRAWDDVDQVIQADVWIVDDGTSGVDDFAQIVRWDISGHTDRNTCGAIHQEIWQSCR